jgi:hypothetical protein
MAWFNKASADGGESCGHREKESRPNRPDFYSRKKKGEINRKNREARSLPIVFQ